MFGYNFPFSRNRLQLLMNFLPSCVFIFSLDLFTSKVKVCTPICMPLLKPEERPRACLHIYTLYLPFTVSINSNFSQQIFVIVILLYVIDSVYMCNNIICHTPRITRIKCTEHEHESTGILYKTDTGENGAYSIEIDYKFSTAQHACSSARAFPICHGECRWLFLGAMRKTAWTKLFFNIRLPRS